MQRCKVPLLTCLLAHPTLVGGVVSSQVEGLDRAPLTHLLDKDDCCCLLKTKHSCLREKENEIYTFLDMATSQGG